MLVSCTSIDDLSDAASIEKFELIDYWPKEIQLEQVEVMDNEVVIPVKYGMKNFPLMLTYRVDFSKTTEDILDSPFTKDTLIFKDINDVKTFRLISESGVPHKWCIRTQEILNKEIRSFTVLNLENAMQIGKPFSKNGVIVVKLADVKGWPITFNADILVTEGAMIDETSYKPGDKLSFSSFNDEKIITVISPDGDKKPWKVKIMTTPPNKDFSQWINSTTIDPTPGIGLGWASANNSFVKGTRQVSNDKGGYAVQLTTSRQNLSFMKLDLIAAGSLFLGEFIFNIKHLDNPKAMTRFGIPFDAKPQKVKIRAKYTPGDQLMQSVKDNSGRWSASAIEGVDKGHIWVQLMRWSGQGELDYHKDPIEGLVVIGEGEYIFTGIDQERNWIEREFPISYTDRTLQPTHIAVVFTSSKEGDYFIGAEGSVLTVDEIDFVY